MWCSPWDANPVRRRLMPKHIVSRYFIELEDGGVRGRVHQDDPEKCRYLDGLRLGPEETVNIKDEAVPLGLLTQALIDFDEEWLQYWFDERGQYQTGVHLYKQLFGRLKPVEIQGKDGEAEIRIITEDEHLARLPWMLLAHHGVFLSTAGWSVGLSNSDDFISCELPPSPKILVVAPQPDNVPETDAKTHLNALKALLASADDAYASGEQLQIVTAWEDFKEALTHFQPHVLYYYGHGVGDRHHSRLVFAAKKDNRVLEKTVADLLPLLKAATDGPPLLAYINCCLGDAGGFLGAGRQLETLIPAVLTNRTVALISAAQAQAMAFWKDVLLKAIPPHIAISRIRAHLGELDLSVSDTRWMTPVLYYRYGHWQANPPKPASRLERDPHWRLKLNRVSQFGQVFFQTYQMFMERKPRALGYLWYGQKKQGLEIFHKRLKVELQEKLIDVVLYEVKPEWPMDLANPDRSFTDMLNQAFGISHADHLAGRIRTHTRGVSGCQTLVYVRHRPITSLYTFHPRFLKTYLQWWDLKFVPGLPEQTHALLGISYEVKNPPKFHELLTKKERLNEADLSYTVFRLLDELERVNRRDLLDFLMTHNIQLPPDLRDDVLEKILEKTGGSYEKVLDELKELESRAWRLRKEAEKAARQEKPEQDEYDDVF